MHSESYSRKILYSVHSYFILGKFLERSSFCDLFCSEMMYSIKFSVMKFCFLQFHSSSRSVLIVIGVKARHTEKSMSFTSPFLLGLNDSETSSAFKSTDIFIFLELLSENFLLKNSRIAFHEFSKQRAKNQNLYFVFLAFLQKVYGYCSYSFPKKCILC